MRTSGVFTTHIFTTKLRIIEPFNIYYFGDVHKYARLHNKEKWQRFLEIAKADKTAYFIGNGDYTEIGSTKERKAIAALNRDSHEDMPRTIDNMLMDQCLGFCKDVEFMKGRIIAIVGGNHDPQFQSGIWMSQKIADILGAKWVGVNGLVRQIIEVHGKRTGITHFLHHGKGGGSSGNAINKVIEMQHIAEADIYSMGDSHTRTIDAKSRIYIGHAGADGEVRQTMRDQVFIRSGSFLNGYVDGEGSYVTDMLLTPSSIGAVRVRVVPRNPQKRVRGGGREGHFGCELIPEFV